MKPQSLSRIAAAGVILLTLLGAGLRAINLNDQLWYDEIVTLVNTVRVPLGTLLTTYTWDNQHTLYSVLAQLSVGAFGEAPWSLRLPAMLLGVAAIPALYLLARAIACRGEALATAALLAVSYHHIFFSQNARGYTGLLLATVVASWCYLQGMRRPGWWPWLGYAVVVALGAYMHLTMVFVAVAHALIVVGLGLRAIWQRRSIGYLARPMGAIVLSGLLTIALYAPMLDDMAAFYLREKGPSVRSQWSTLSWAMLETINGLRLGLGTIFLLAAAALGAVGCLRIWRRSPATLLLVLLPGLLALAVMLVLGRNIWPRFFFFAFGLTLIVVASGIWGMAELAAGAVRRLRPRWPTPYVTAGLAGSVVLVLLAQSGRMLGPLYQYPKQDLAGALAFVEAQRQPQEPVVTVGMATIPYHWYYQVPWQAVEQEAELDAILHQGRRTWLVYTFPIHLRSRYPEIAQRVEDEFIAVKTFPATIGDGQVHVLTNRPLAALRGEDPSAVPSPAMVSALTPSAAHRSAVAKKKRS